MIESILKTYMNFVKSEKSSSKDRSFWSLVKEWLHELMKTIIFLIGLAGTFWIIRHF